MMLILQYPFSHPMDVMLIRAISAAYCCFYSASEQCLPII